MGNEIKLYNSDQMITQGIALVDDIVNKNYIADIETHHVIPISEASALTQLGFIRISKVVTDAQEQLNDKLASVYSALYNFGATIITMLVGSSDRTDYYIGVRHKKPAIAKDILKKSLSGNLPGIEYEDLAAKQIKELQGEKLPVGYAGKCISSVYAVPGIRDKDNFVQGIEKFIDTMAGDTYTALFISTPVGKNELEMRKRGFENLYATLSTYSEISLTYGKDEGRSVTDTTGKNFAETIGEAISDANGTSYGTSDSRSENESRTSSESNNRGESYGGGMYGSLSSGSSYGSSRGTSWGTSHSSSDTHSNMHTKTSNQSRTNGESTSKSIASTLSSSASIAMTKQVKSVQSLMEKVEGQLQRIANGEAYGLWESSCYFITDKPSTALVTANTYKALLIGEKTETDRSFINLWESGEGNNEKILNILAYLRNGRHPIFAKTEDTRKIDIHYVEEILTAPNLVTGSELPILMGLPQKSVSGMTSIAYAAFGRNIKNEKDKKIISLGTLYHLGKALPQNDVSLTVDTLTSHCFITGTTGAGKSTTVIKILDELQSIDNGAIKFLVIEPAKGEYKKDLGNLPGINIFTTNPKYFQMLRLNPFIFDDEIHVLEHLDKLIEIFSACWPLYAAMPAVLKEAFEKSYTIVGWDIKKSIYIGQGLKRFPNFKTVLEILPKIIEESKFSAENKGNYIGALETRVRSLTTGIMGTIFTESDQIPDEVIFDQNTIIDLSRIGSSETKSLIMGILILKLNEYRMANAQGSNRPLRHITVLEEAHNILKRVSQDQSQESANVAGKSVEMICNSIAEMRTYGEGFIIADQSPSAVAQAAITNTNTKIIMRLADYSDCEAVGRSVSLDDLQIKELSRLNRGIAVVHQSDWMEAVLTEIQKSKNDYKTGDVIANDLSKAKEINKRLISALLRQYKSKAFHKKELKNIAKENSFSSAQEALIDDYFNNGGEFSKLIVDLLDCREIFNVCMPKFNWRTKSIDDVTYEQEKEVKIWLDGLIKALRHYVALDKKLEDLVIYRLLIYAMDLSWEYCLAANIASKIMLEGRI